MLLYRIQLQRLLLLYKELYRNTEKKMQGFVDDYEVLLSTLSF